MNNTVLDAYYQECYKHGKIEDQKKVTTETCTQPPQARKWINSGVVAEYERSFAAGGGQIIELDLSRNYFGSNSGFDCFVESLKEATSLQVLKLDNTLLSNGNVKSLGEALKRLPCLHTVSLKDNQLYIDGGKELVRLARANRQVCVIDISATGSKHSNKTPEKILRELDHALRDNQQKMTDAL